MSARNAFTATTDAADRSAPFHRQVRPLAVVPPPGVYTRPPAPDTAPVNNPWSVQLVRSGPQLRGMSVTADMC